MLDSPDEIDGLATRLRSKAEGVRAVADDHVRAGLAAHWVSDSASAHRDRIWADRMAAYAAADEMDEAAHLFNRHADAVRERLPPTRRPPMRSSTTERVPRWTFRPTRLIATHKRT